MKKDENPIKPPVNPNIVPWNRPVIKPPAAEPIKPETKTFLYRRLTP